MIFQKFKTNSVCVGGRHRSSTKNIYGNNITSKGSKIITEYCSICDRKRFKTVTDSIIQAERLGSYSKFWEAFLLKLAKN